MSIDGKMVERLHADIARRVIALAGAMEEACGEPVCAMSGTAASHGYPIAVQDKFAISDLLFDI